MEVLNNTDINKETVIIPFGFSYNPMKKLAIIPFEKYPDSIYKGLELQYFDDDIYGKGYRVIAYGIDGYVDVYDDKSLNNIENEKFDVTGKGLCEKINVDIKNTVFEKKDGCMNISFSFTDKSGREIVLRIVEKTARKTNSMNLIAPIGSSTENPSYLPLFFLYDFDFIRKNKTDVELTIDGKTIKQDRFPVPLPKDFQWRYYSRYTPDCEIIEFATKSNETLKEHITNSSGIVVLEDLEYKYMNSNLKKITLQNSSHTLYIEFCTGFPNVKTVEEGTKYMDTFNIVSDESMGLISGHYSIERNNNLVKIELIPSEGWTPVPNSPLTKFMFGKKSVFCSWPKTYRYIQNIDITNLNSASRWERIK